MKPLQQSTVLVVDDTPANLGVLFDYLQTFEFKVRVAQSGPRAIEIVRKEKPDIILLDINMPEMDGFEVCRRLKADETTRAIPVIFMSALSETVDKLTGFQVGGVDYVTKPFQTEEILARVVVHLNLHNLQQEIEEKNTQLQQEITKYQQIKKTLQKRTQELQCLHKLSALIKKTGNALEAVLQGIVELIPPAWQYPEITSAQIILGDLTVSTGNFKKTPWKQSIPIVMYGKPVGTLEVSYLENRPKRDDGPFLREERLLLEVIAERIGRLLERLSAEKRLRQSRVPKN